jgi:hypothetical protein
MSTTTSASAMYVIRFVIAFFVIVLRLLRSIALARGRVSIVIMILLMLVGSERNLLIFYRTQFNRKRSRNAAQEVELVFVHGDGVESLT